MEWAWELVSESESESEWEWEWEWGLVPATGSATCLRRRILRPS